jgi:hypothetical protein
MKGIIFTEFLEMVEQKFGVEVLENVIDTSELKSQGIYTAVGTYEFSEMLSLITNLSKQINIDPQTLIHAYGIYFFLMCSQMGTPTFLNTIPLLLVYWLG